MTNNQEQEYHYFWSIPTTDLLRQFNKTEEKQQEYLTFSDEQKENLEFNLKQFLFNYLKPKQINKYPNLNTIIQPRL